ncbi:hypothetical protein Tco_1368461 [Tanacetum coccineum]
MPGALQRPKGYAAVGKGFPYGQVIPLDIGEVSEAMASLYSELGRVSPRARPRRISFQGEKNVLLGIALVHHRFPDLIPKYQKVQLRFFKNGKSLPSNGVRVGKVGYQQLV